MAVLVAVSCSLTYVLDLDSCRDLPSRRYHISTFTNDDLAIALAFRNLGPFRALGTLLLGKDEKRSLNFDVAALVSSHGWSIYLPSIGMKDPDNIQPFAVAIARGMSMRHSERKQWIIDSTFSRRLMVQVPGLPVSHDADRNYTFIDGPDVTDLKVFVGIQGNAFAVSIRFEFGGCQHATGYRQLQHMRGHYRLVPACVHTSQTMEEVHPRLDQKLCLLASKSCQGSMFVGCALRTPFARWMMMFTLRKCLYPHLIDRSLFLAGQSCWANCAIERTHDPEGITSLVL